MHAYPLHVSYVFPRKIVLAVRDLKFTTFHEFKLLFFLTNKQINSSFRINLLWDGIVTLKMYVMLPSLDTLTQEWVS